MYSTIFQPNATLFGSAIIILVAVVCIIRWHIDPLRKVPGPRIACFTDLWRLRNALSGKEETINLELHEKYGSIVRAGPTTVYVNDPEILSKAYRWNRGRGLGAFFEALDMGTLGVETDTKLHGLYRPAFKQVVSPLAVMTRFYVREVAQSGCKDGTCFVDCPSALTDFQLSLVSVLEHEATIDKLIERLFQKLQLNHAGGEVCDLSKWINLLPPDLASALLWSKPIGLIEQGEDLANIVYGVDKLISAAVVVHILPSIPDALSKIGLRLLMKRLLKRVNSVWSLIELVENVVTKRLEGKCPNVRQDIVQKLIDFRDRDGEGFPRQRLNGEIYGLVTAGSTTTASVLKMAVVFVATNPHVLNKLVMELDEAEEEGLLSPVLQHKETSHLHYLTAILNETLRLRSPQVTPLPREVPKGGAQVCGYYLPGGTHVGIAPWSFQARKDLYGEDVRSFRPERWLEDEKHARFLQKSATTFGGGYTSCVGKNVADITMNKFIAQLFRRYHVIIQNPSQPINKVSCFSITYSDLMVKLVPRGRNGKSSQ